MSEVTARRGHIAVISAEPGMALISASLPEVEVEGLITELRSATAGRSKIVRDYE
jgi:translation elongation factor EF-G